MTAQIEVGQTAVDTVNGLPVLVTRLADVVSVSPAGRTVEQHYRREVIGAVAELASVVVEPDDFGPDCWHVYPVWARVDRTSTGGIAVRGRKIADRLARAIRDGVAVTGDAVLVDNAGQTYVDQRTHVLTRILNAELRRLGY